MIASLKIKSLIRRKRNQSPDPTKALVRKNSAGYYAKLEKPGPNIELDKLDLTGGTTDKKQDELKFKRNLAKFFIQGTSGMIVKTQDKLGSKLNNIQLDKNGAYGSASMRVMPTIPISREGSLDRLQSPASQRFRPN
jgi:hypothetical protein